MTRGRYLELDDFGRDLARQTDVTLVRSENPVKFQLNDYRDESGDTQYLSYNRNNTDILDMDSEVVAKVVEGEKDQWEKLLEPETESKLSSFTTNYSLEVVDGQIFITTETRYSDRTTDML